MQYPYPNDENMGIGTVPPYMTSTLPGFNRQRSPFPPPNADHYFQKQSFPAASPLPSAAANGSGVDEEGSDGSGSYIEMDELSLGPGENQKKRYSKRRRSTKSSQKHSDQHSGQRAATTPHGNALVSSLLPSHQATPYLQPSFTLKSMRQVEQAVSDSFIPSSPEMTLGEFVSKHQHEFPVRVRVSRGFYGTTDRWSISEGELFNIHFVKYTKVVATTDGGSGHYYIPINSAVEFASLYAPNDEVEAGLKGFSFKTARDITSQRTMPQIVRATASCIRPGSPEASVNANELLVLKKVKRPFFGSPVLHCVNPLTGEKKILPATSTGHFSTNPFQVRLFLPEVIQHLTFPGQFVMFINPDMNCDLPDDLFTRPITLSHCSIETSLVATQQESTTTNDPRDHVLLEIPIDLDIGVELVKPRAEEMAQLFEDTQDIYDNFDVSHLKVIPSNAASSDLNPDVTKAVTTIRRGKGNVGVHLQQSLRYSTAVGGGYSQPLELFTPIQKMKQGNNSKSHSVSEDERMATLESQVCQMAEQIKVLKRQLKRLTAQQQRMQQSLTATTTATQDLQTKENNRKGPPLKLPPKPKTMRHPHQTEEEQNREYLSTLTLPQVMELLDRLRMTRYQALFHKHRITGQQLVLMRGPELTQLGVSPGEHCRVLMNIINGHTSTEDLLQE